VVQNKTLRAIFNNKHVMDLLETNYKTFCALNSVQAASSDQFKETVLQLLAHTELSDKRSSKLEQDDFLKLLAAFNQAGIHFNTGVGIDEPDEAIDED